jgi:hypothetical protein
MSPELRMLADLYERTPQGQLLYDLAFTDLSAKYLARKHKIPIAKIRSMRANKEIVMLRRQVRRDRRGRSHGKAHKG